MGYRNGKPSRFDLWKWGLQSRYWKRTTGCSDTFCNGPRRKHAPCALCGSATEDRGVYVERGTLRRRVGPLCWDCSRGNPVQAVLVKQRTERDMPRVTDPLDTAAILPRLLPEQYPSRVRTVLRTFVDADVDEAVVPRVTVATLAGSIAALKLDRVMYAEQRGNKTVLRRVTKVGR